MPEETRASARRRSLVVPAMNDILFDIAAPLIIIPILRRLIVPGWLESRRCRRRGCRECFFVFPCGKALVAISAELPIAFARK